MASRDRQTGHWLRASGYHVNAFLEPEYREKLERLLKRLGVPFARWLRDRINEDLRLRTPESQGGVEFHLAPGDGEDVLFYLHRLAQREAEGLRAALASTPRDLSGPAAERRAFLRREVDFAYHAAAWCHELLEAFRLRRYVLESGQRAPRHRLKSSEAPPKASSVVTTSAPTG
jgi:hypothetical protein